MLEAYIIEQIKRKEEEARRHRQEMLYEQPALDDFGSPPPLTYRQPGKEYEPIIHIDINPDPREDGDDSLIIEMRHTRVSYIR